MDTIGVQMGKDMADSAVLAGGIHGLEHDDEAVGALGIELGLQQVQLLQCFGKGTHFDRFLIHIHIAGRREFLQIDFLPFLGPIAVNIDFYRAVIFLFRHRFLIPLIFHNGFSPCNPMMRK